MNCPECNHDKYDTDAMMLVMGQEGRGENAHRPHLPRPRAQVEGQGVSLLSFPREIGLKRALVKSQHAYDNYEKRLGTLSSCYTSLYSFTRMNEEGRPTTGMRPLTVRGGTLMQENEEALNRSSAMSPTLSLVWLAMSASSLLGEASMSTNFLTNQWLAGEYRLPLGTLSTTHGEGAVTLDGVGFEKMTRIPCTYNPKRGRWAVVIDARAFAKDPDNYPILFSGA